MHLAAAKEIARFEGTERSAGLMALIDAALDQAYLQFRHVQDG
ncbi:hypothetical protein [Ferranicluibacter rubi]|nr:hypothetical protein [Ferranicluibacter rubi]